ncbi:HNH endonuclease [Rhodopirellula bahusiensis]|uniref:HNH endonuclease n=1 Tax=Rhodopirellula bahusiensis TaxID=2014065 RepID=UPI003D65FCFB
MEGSRCDKHKPRGRKNRSGDPFYSSGPWRRLRRARLTAEPLCRSCHEAGRVREGSRVDHILPRADRPDLELEFDNTQSLCESCHNRKTMGENWARWRNP